MGRRREEETVDAGVGGNDVAESMKEEDISMGRMLKRLKTLCPEELNKLSKAAAEMEKAKIEDKRKVDEFVAKTPDFATLIDDCYICMEPLLNNIGTTKFGVISWQCRCTVAQKAHASCLFSKICRSSKCDMCNSPILFDSPRANRDAAQVRFVNSKTPRMPSSFLSPGSRSDIGDHRHDQDAASEASTVTDDGEGRDRAPLAAFASDHDASVRRSFSATDNHDRHNNDDDHDDDEDDGLEDDQYDEAEHDDHGEDDDHEEDDGHGREDDHEEDDHGQDDQNEEYNEDEGGDFAPAVHADEDAYADEEEDDERQRVYVQPYIVNSEVQVRRGSRSRSRRRRVDDDNEDEMVYI